MIEQLPSKAETDARFTEVLCVTSAAEPAPAKRQRFPFITPHQSKQKLIKTLKTQGKPQ